jgi:hypothetical protein
MFYIDRYAHVVATLGLEPTFARYLAATVLVGLSLAVLEATVRTLKNMFIEIAPLPTATPGRRDGERTRLWLVVIAGGILALHDGRGLGGLAAWPLLALSSLWLAAAGFVLIALALRRAQLPIQITLALATVVAALAAWSSFAQLWSWWQAGTWLEFSVGVIITVLAGVILGGAIVALQRPAAAQPESTP